MIQAPPFEGRSLRSIRLPRPPPSVSTSSSDSEGGPEQGAPPSQALRGSTTSDAGPDHEAQLLQAIQQILAAAGRRPLTASVGPSERVVVEIVCHVHTAV
jgi:hypothetical protein